MMQKQNNLRFEAFQNYTVIHFEAVYSAVVELKEYDLILA